MAEALGLRPGGIAARASHELVEVHKLLGIWYNLYKRFDLVLYRNKEVASERREEICPWCSQDAKSRTRRQNSVIIVSNRPSLTVDGSRVSIWQHIGRSQGGTTK